MTIYADTSALIAFVFDVPQSERVRDWFRRTLGRTERGRLLHVTFTLRREGCLIRVIFARDMSARARNVYEKTA